MPINPYARKQAWKSYGKGPNGRNLCHCGCGREVVPPRRTAFSDECVNAFKMHSDPATIRRIVQKRDRGICALCCVDTALRAKLIREHRRLWMWFARKVAEELFWSGKLEMYLGFTDSEKRMSAYRKEAERAKIEFHDSYLWACRWVENDLRETFGETHSGHQWEADHIIPVVEGGGGCGPEGYRTLCIACHKKETAALAARRAAKRRTPVPELNLI